MKRENAERLAAITGGYIYHTGRDVWAVRVELHRGRRIQINGTRWTVHDSQDHVIAIMDEEEWDD